MSSKTSFEQLRTNLSGKPLVQFKPSRRSDTSIEAGPFETANSPVAAGGSAIDPNLLSPPLSVDSLDTPPFKPADSDQTSLSMKHRRHRRSRRHRDGLDRASTGDTDGQMVTQRHGSKRLASTSVPDLRNDAKSQQFSSAAGQFLMRQQMQALHIAHRRASIARSVGSKRRASLPQKPRRWTMPSKAASTRVLSESPTPMITTTLVSNTDPHQSFDSSAEGRNRSQQSLPCSSQAGDSGSASNAGETPAMITLRRATSKKGPSALPRRMSLRPDAIISFPPPKFNRTTSTYFASFFGLTPPSINFKSDNSIQTSVRQSSWSTGQDPCPSMRKASVTADRVQLTANTVAAPAFTQVEFLPRSHAHAAQQELLALSARRCSTTIISGSSVHEIIWDENLTSSSEGSTGAEVSRQTSRTAKKSENHHHNRRQSAIMEKLEAQLRHNDQRKASLDSQSSDEFQVSASKRGRKTSRLRKLTEWNVRKRGEADQLFQPSTPMDLKSDLSHDLSGCVTGLFATHRDEEDVSPTDEPVKFFPPLEGTAGNSQRSSVSREHSSHPDAKHVVIEQPLSPFHTADPCFSKPISNDKGKGKARSHSAHFFESRQPSFSHHNLTMGSALGRSSHMRRRSTEQQISRSTSWSRKSSKTRANPDDEYDERVPLLGNEQRFDDDPARPYVFLDGHSPSMLASQHFQKDDDLRPRKMSVQDFVQKIERMNSVGRQLPRWVDAVGNGNGSGTESGPGMGGLVRRDSPWLVRRRVSAGAAEMDVRMRRESGTGNGRGKVLSEVGEEGGGSGADMGPSEGGSEVFI